MNVKLEGWQASKGYLGAREEIIRSVWDVGVTSVVRPDRARLIFHLLVSVFAFMHEFLCKENHIPHVLLCILLLINL